MAGWYPTTKGIRGLHVCPEVHAKAKMAKNRQTAGDSTRMQKVAPWRVAILPKTPYHFRQNRHFH